MTLIHIGEHDEDDPTTVDPVTVQLADQFLRRVIGGRPDWDNDEDLAKTPERFAKMLRELTISDEFDFTVFENEKGGQEMVILKDIAFVSLCSHHIIPFVGRAHVGYIPDTRVAGLSKLARAVKFMSAGLWTQEDLTGELATYLEDVLEPLGIIVVMSAEHFCMSIRGIRNPGAQTVTSAVRGVFLDPPEGRDPKGEFLELLRTNL
jgi:GTP cyclohydrolase I